MDPVSLVLGLIGGLVVVVLAFGIRQLLRRKIKTASAHTETWPAQVFRSAPPAPAPQALDLQPSPASATPASHGPIQALMTYTKADGSTRVRDLTMYSRTLKDGQTYSINGRQQGETITKQFLLSGISRLELPGLSPPLVLISGEQIKEWLDQHLAERLSAARTTRPRDLARSTPAQPAPVTSAPGKPGNDSWAEALPAVPLPPPPPPPRLAAAEPSEIPTLPGLLPDGAKGFAVLDLETTGTGRSCRIVEIALVRLNPQGRITEEWETLVHPGMPIPNAHIHGIDDALVAGAPSFAEIAGLLAAKLHEHVLVAHNLRHFDGPILEAHFAEVDGIDLTLGSGIDTMPKPRVKLVDLCARHGVELDPVVAHTALGDTRALVKALLNGMAHLEPASHAVTVLRNGLISLPTRSVTRGMATSAKGPASGWTATSLQLEAGQVFITTGPPSMKTDTDIKRAEAHGIRIGLQYRKAASIPKRQPPDFLLSSSLTLSNRKMADAKELQLPVVLCSDFVQARCGGSVRAWRHQG